MVFSLLRALKSGLATVEHRVSCDSDGHAVGSDMLIGNNDPNNGLQMAGVNLDSWMTIGDSLKGIEVDNCVPVETVNNQTY
mmetsp:Transcript_45984/g.67460  ORF Transcript_45984/g.67460 Transcript_45984/m.67460 type:complete len:81 (+) Transcript_45984:1-243(+)